MAIHTTNTGRQIHVGGRIVLPELRRSKAIFKLTRDLIDVSKWPVADASHYSDAPDAQAVLRDILMNDSLGCCTQSDKFHRQALRQAAGGLAVYHPTSEDVIAGYSRDGGYVPGQAATDGGCDETVVLDNARDQGIPSGPAAIHRSKAWAQIDGSDTQLVRACVDAFVGASICVPLPDTWIQMVEQNDADGFVWADGTPNPDNGHCFTVGDQQSDGCPIWSWARKGFMPWSGFALVQSAGGLYIELDDDILNAASQKAPDMLDMAALSMQFSQVSGGAIVPPGP